MAFMSVAPVPAAGKQSESVILVASPGHDQGRSNIGKFELGPTVLTP